jgi:transcription antitermination factor NusA-like protein
MLCQKCSAKVKAGEITDLDLRIAKLLINIEEKYPSLQNVCFYKALEVEKTLAIIVGHGDVPRLLGYGGKIIKALSDESGKNVRILEYGVDDRKFLEDLFIPFSILTINTIWLPDGTTETRVILKRKRGSQLPFDLTALKEIARKVRKMSIRVEFAD